MLVNVFLLGNFIHNWETEGAKFFDGLVQDLSLVSGSHELLNHLPVIPEEVCGLSEPPSFFIAPPSNCFFNSFFQIISS